ncbi:DNA polymerase-beta/AP pol [Mythimna separata entomopoxvirus 'L']|uniref:Probable AP endonuclease n=1 Tax=Mythimna separata entomopoxvirus 'L' TaxID=1293572 RepID=A0A916KQD2_9POXV|nr:DNA polymerase-beta/AP pol [Mythimna separata entomopoxvirus 'L']CCU56431.1 DNA polymerase-beta/AP pol [Mythimna separata entomopoxvirus 'L']
MNDKNKLSILNNNYVGFHTLKEYLDNYLCPLQFFVGAPHGYQSTDYLNKTYTNRKIFVHSKYVGNIAKHKSTVTLRNIKKELLYLENMKISNSGTVVHLSLYYDETPEESLIYVSGELNKFCQKLNTILDNNYYNHIIFETTNDIKHLGAKTEHFKILYDNLDDNAKKRVRFCIDTSHIFVTFYNIDTGKGMAEYLSKFDLLIGLDKIILIHLNDSKGLPLSSYKPHEAIGKGNIFKNYNDKNNISSLYLLKAYAYLYNIPCILERRNELPDNSLIEEMKLYLDINTNETNISIFMAIINKHKIILALTDFMDLYNIINEPKFISYRNAITTIQQTEIIVLEYKNINNKYTLIESKENIIEKYKNLKYIGPSISDIIYELLSTNNIQKLSNLKNSISYNYIKKLTSILFIGPNKAKQLIDLNIKNINDIIAKKNYIIENGILTKNKLKIIEYIKDIEPIQRNFIDELKQNIKLNKKYEWYILGSYARGMNYSKDIDILIVDFDIDIFLHEIVKIYKLVYIIRQSKNIFSGVFNFKNKKFILEINRVENNQKYTAIMHFTGSKGFNIIMRNIAKTENMTLNQYALKKDGIPLHINKEEDIFNYLKIHYIPNNKRNL